MTGRARKGDTTSPDPQGTPPSGPPEQGVDVPIHLVRGSASSEELSALIAVVAVLSSAGGDDRDGGPGQSDQPSSGNRTYPRSRWSSPARMVRTTPPHGPGGWRASAFPRYRANRPAGPVHPTA